MQTHHVCDVHFFPILVSTTFGTFSSGILLGEQALHGHQVLGEVCEVVVDGGNDGADTEQLANGTSQIAWRTQEKSMMGSLKQ